MACILRNHQKNVCNEPFHIRKRINELICDEERKECRTSLTTLGVFEELEFNFDELFNGRSRVNSPCCSCPHLKCNTCIRVKKRKCRKKNKRK